jgi:hypothetical protein
VNRWLIEPRKTMGQPLLTVSKATSSGEVVLGAVKGTVYEAMIDIVVHMEPGDAIVTPHGSYYLLYPRPKALA